MSDVHRAAQVEILIRQQRFADAEKILKDLLSQDPNNTRYLALFAEVNLQQHKTAIAHQVIDNAISLAPDYPYLFFIKARIFLTEEKYDNCEKYLNQAIQLDPHQADFFGLLAHVKLNRKHYQEALDLANKALAVDAENILGLNTRSTALLKLNRKEESFKTIEGALNEDPNNVFTHTTYGWSLLEKGDHKKAKEHFKEALQRDPNFRYAQAGLMEAIKATNPFYRLFLRYSFFMGNLTAKYQWAVIIGFYLGIRLLRYLSENNPALQPYLVPLIIALTLIAFSTWVITPISNLFLRFNKYGKLLLDRKQKISSNFVAGSFALFILGVLLYFVMKDDRYLTIAVFGFAMMLPFGVMFNPTKQKNALIFYAAAMAVVGILAIAIAFKIGEIFNQMTLVFVVGFVAFQFLANYLMIRQDNR